jgi:hypothetical protein
MKTLFIVLLALLTITGCNQDSNKLNLEKEIFFAAINDPGRDLETEITSTMGKQHLQTQGQAMLYILDQGIQSGSAQPSGQTPDQAVLSRQVRAMIQARESIAGIEADVGK